MARAARALLPLYTEVDPDLAIAGIPSTTWARPSSTRGARGKARAPGHPPRHVVLGYQLVRKAALKAKLDPERRSASST